jgi:DNA-directed RNA polymerase specialized sigma24 family protein
MDDPHHGSLYEQELAKIFESQTELERLTRELTLYTARKHGKRAYVRRTPEDYPNEAIMRTMDGRRRYHFDKPFKKHLESAIDSIVSHDLEDAAREVHIVDRGDLEDGEPLGGYDARMLVAHDRTEAEVIERVDGEHDETVRTPQEQQCEQLRRAGCSARKRAEILGIREDEVRNIDRRITRRKRKRNVRKPL